MATFLILDVSIMALLIDVYVCAQI
jgi:hypothetical protein